MNQGGQRGRGRGRGYGGRGGGGRGGRGENMMYTPSPMHHHHNHQLAFTDFAASQFPPLHSTASPSSSMQPMFSPSGIPNPLMLMGTPSAATMNWNQNPMMMMPFLQPPPRPFNNAGMNNHKPKSTSPRVPAPPAVPRFGSALPSPVPPPLAVTRQQPKKKKRKLNQLGLTPQKEEHESSEEEEDVDEEAKLGAKAGTPASGPLQFTYRGRTSILRTPADIAAWIEERKSKYPTQARVEEKTKAMEAAKKAREQAMREKREAQRRKRDEDNNNNNTKDGEKTAKAKQKVDRLRRKIIKEEKKLAKIEEEIDQGEVIMKEVPTDTNGAGNENAQSSPSPMASSIMDKPQPERNKLAEPSTKSTANESSSDWTSSSGSDDSASSSDSGESDSSNSAPEETTTRREGPERVPPPARDRPKKRLCRHFARSGHCLHGNKCKFSHEMPERKARPQPTVEKKSGRKGLLQAVSVQALCL